MSQVEELLCPNCGHHVANMTRAEPRVRDGVVGQITRGQARDFLAARVRERHHHTVRSDAMYAAFREWTSEVGCPPMSPKALGIALRELGLEPYRTRAERGYADVELV